MCEIVKNWVGTMDNEFYYCREHKVECQAGSCSGTTPKAVATQPKVESPWYAPANLTVGLVLRCIKPPHQGGAFRYKGEYSIKVVSPAYNEVILEDDLGAQLSFQYRDIGNYFELVPHYPVPDGGHYFD